MLQGPLYFSAHKPVQQGETDHAEKGHDQGGE